MPRSIIQLPPQLRQRSLAHLELLKSLDSSPLHGDELVHEDQSVLLLQSIGMFAEVKGHWK